MKKLFLIFTILFACALPVTGFAEHSEMSAIINKYCKKVPNRIFTLDVFLSEETNTIECELVCGGGYKAEYTQAQIDADVEAFCAKQRIQYNNVVEENKKPVSILQIDKSTNATDTETGSAGAVYFNEEVNDEYDPTQDSQGAPFAPTQNNAWNTNYEDSDETSETENTINPDKSLLAQLGTKKTTTKKTDGKTRKTLLLDAYLKYCDDEGFSAPNTLDLGAKYAAEPTIDCDGEKGKVILHCYKRKDISQSLNQDDLKYFCSPDKITNFIIQTTTRPSTHIRDCNTNEKKAINATDCKISPDGKYSDIKCDNQKGYRPNANLTACEKSGRQETNKKCTQEQLTQLNAQSGKLYYYAETPNTQYCGITQCKNNFVINNDKPQEKCVCPTEKGFEEKEGKCVKKNEIGRAHV